MVLLVVANLSANGDLNVLLILSWDLVCCVGLLRIIVSSYSSLLFCCLASITEWEIISLLSENHYWSEKKKIQALVPSTFFFACDSRQSLQGFLIQSKLARIDSELENRKSVIDSFISSRAPIEKSTTRRTDIQEVVGPMGMGSRESDHLGNCTNIQERPHTLRFYFFSFSQRENTPACCWARGNRV